MSAIGAAISGLQSSQTWLDVISNNVSNSQTVGFKGSRANFASLISQSETSPSGPDTEENLGGIDPSQLGLGVEVESIQTLFTQGAIQVTGNATDVAIQGSGFLVEKQGENTYYTRAGNLTTDQEGNLVSSTGGLIQGWELQTTTNSPGAVDPAAPMTVIGTKLDTSNTADIGNIVVPGNMEIAPKATSSIASPASVLTGGVVLGGNLDNNTPINANPLPTTAVAVTALQLSAFTPDATTTFTAYDSLGTAYTFTMEWQQTAVTPQNQAQWTWTMFNTTGGAAPSATAVWPEPGSEVANSAGLNLAGGANNSATTAIAGVNFNPNGSLASNGVAGFNNIQLTFDDTDGAVGPGGVKGQMSFSINLGTPNNNTVAPPTYGLSNGMTGDYGNGSTTNGVYTPVQTVTTVSADGYAVGTLTGISFSQTGQINATFSNNQTIAVAQLAMANFANEGGLSSVGTTEYQSTANSGIAQIGTAGANGFGTITGGALEESNVDLTVELTNMILAQNMFEANSRVVTTADTVISNLVQMAQNVQG